MLIITRRVDEAIFIDEDIDIVITKIDGNQVGIGIDAPRDVEIWREELYDTQ